MINKKNINNILAFFLISHLVIWTLIPSYSNVNLPLDTIEALAWGSNLEWGFNKHPPLSALIVEIFYQLFGSSDWSFYLLSQIFLVSTFLIIWNFSRNFFQNETYALISVLILEGIYFYNFTTPEFNVNVCQMPFWALSVHYCWQGIKNNNYKDWIKFGIFAGLGFLSKYLFIYLIASLSVFLIFKTLKNKKFNIKYLLTLFVFLITISPHIFWLIKNEYITLVYGLNRTGIDSFNFLNHIYFPVVFLLKQLGILIPFILIFYSIIKKFKPKFNIKDSKLLFLLAVNILPLIFIFLTSLIGGVKIRTMWMSPFYLFFGVLFVYLFKSQINLKKFNFFLKIFSIFFIISPTIYLYISLSQTDKRTDYPGKEIAYLVQKKWNQNFNNEIALIIGDEWSGGNLSYHLKSRPKWLNSLDKNKIKNIKTYQGVIYVGNPEILKKVCPGVYGAIKPNGFCMIGSK